MEANCGDRIVTTANPLNAKPSVGPSRMQHATDAKVLRTSADSGATIVVVLSATGSFMG